MVNRFYSSTAQEATLSAPVDSSSPTLSVSGTTGFPLQFPYTLILDRGTASEEIVQVSSAVGPSLTVVRGVDGTTAISHNIGATVVHGVSARDHREPQEHLAASSGVHGATGNIVGTTDMQTLTNKTFSGGAINSAEINGATINTATINLPIIEQPAIDDFTLAQHNHGTPTAGGALPQASVTGLPTRLNDIEAVNTTQTGNISTLQGTVTTQGSTLTSQGNRITTLENEFVKVQSNQVLISFTSQRNFTRSIIFPTPFQTSPTVVTNINSGAGETALWTTRAFAITTSGFSLFGFQTTEPAVAGPADTWANIEVQWIAFDPTATP